MTAVASAETWTEANQRYLAASVERVRLLLLRHAGQADPAEVDAAQSRLEVAAAALAEPSALKTLTGVFGLSGFERDVLLLALGMELDGSFAAACAISDPTGFAYPTFGLALAALPEAHWSALTPASPLRRWRLVELGQGEALTRRALRIDERVLHFLAGAPHLDERLASLLTPVTPGPELPPSQQAVAEELAAVLSAHDAGPALVNLHGMGQSDLRAVAAEACAGLDLTLYSLRMSDIPASSSEREAMARLCEREVALGACALMLEYDDGLTAEGLHNARALIDVFRVPLIVTSREPLAMGRRPFERVQVDAASTAEQLAMWRQSLPGITDELPERLVSQFRLGASQIEAVMRSHRPALGPAEPAGESLWDACRSHARPALDDLAQRIVPAATWDDLVLPEPQRDMLRDLLAHVRQRSTVYETWGFAGKGNRGLGISALFAGPSGTGKTMAAEVLAGALRLDVYRIDLSQVVSKYIGETEKNLRRVFDAAESGGAILLFDEADALFGKRSEVKDSHDRYANIEVSYLLQRMEAYRGLAILTTNQKSALDAAFLRRLRFVINFPFPDAVQRAEIWRRAFPAATPLETVDYERLARLSLAGGNIRNVALHAAVLAADEGRSVSMSHLLRGARVEFAKLEKPLSPSETEGWL